MSKGGVYVEPGLYRLERESGAVVWIAMANGITLMSYSEAYAREWLEREGGAPPDAA
jgi:hypothetical protein